MFASEPGCATKRPPRTPEARAELVAIVTAIPEEFDAIAKFVYGGERRRIGRRHRGSLLRGKLAGTPIILAMTGDGEVQAERGLSFLLRETRVSFLIGAGAAGALRPALGAGEILVSASVADAEGNVSPPDAGWVSRAVALGAKPATVVSAGRPVCSSNEKRDLAASVGGADLAAAVVDMESASWARTAAAHGIPYVILRAVSDTLDESLPGFLRSCLSADGSVDRAAVARRLVLHPGALPTLLRARRRVREGAEAIGRFLERLLPEKI